MDNRRVPLYGNDGARAGPQVTAWVSHRSTHPTARNVGVRAALGFVPATHRWTLRYPETAALVTPALVLR